jgi:hypothetical protein
MPRVLCFCCSQEWLKKYLFVPESQNIHICYECDAIWDDDGHGNPIEKSSFQHLDDLWGDRASHSQFERIFDHTLFNVGVDEIKDLVLQAWLSPNKQKDPTQTWLEHYWIVDMCRPVGRFGETKILLEERHGIIVDAVPAADWYLGDIPDTDEFYKTAIPGYENAFKLEENATIEDLIREAWSLPSEFKKRQNSFSWLINMTRVVGIHGETKLLFCLDPQTGQFVGIMPIK